MIYLIYNIIYMPNNRQNIELAKAFIDEYDKLQSMVSQLIVLSRTSDETSNDGKISILPSVVNIMNDLGVSIMNCLKHIKQITEDLILDDESKIYFKFNFHYLNKEAEDIQFIGWNGRNKTSNNAGLTILDIDFTKVGDYYSINYNNTDQLLLELRLVLKSAYLYSKSMLIY